MEDTDRAEDTYPRMKDADRQADLDRRMEELGMEDTDRQVDARIGDAEGAEASAAWVELPPFAAEGFEPRAVVAACIESGTRAVLLDAGALPSTFFDLSTGVAGDLVQRLVLYEIRMAVVVPDPSIHSPSFRDFAREANGGRWYRFFPTRAAAVAWLEAG